MAATAGARLFVTGATGLVGRALLSHLDGGPVRVVGLSRSVSAAPQRNVRLVNGALDRPEGWRAALEGVDLVLHLAAATGKRRPEEYRRVNVEGTASLLEECRRAGIRRFLHVSTIAAGFPDLRHYPYARSKLEAESLVRASGLRWGIARPTMVLGKRSPIWLSLASLARLPVVPIFGDGRARVQPVHVDDLARLLAAWIFDESLEGEVLDFGGAEVTTMGDFMRRTQSALRKGPARSLRVPVKPWIPLLAKLEPLLLPLMPVTAGQLESFVQDSVARPNALSQRFAGELRGVDAMLRELSA